MLTKSLVLFLFGTLVVAEIPSYMKICGRKNPELATCVRNSVEGLREKFRSGMPELEVPTMEPLTLKGFPLSDTEQLRAIATNVKLYGLTNFETKDLKIDLEKKKIDIDVVFNELKLHADYEVRAKILVPIEGAGPIDITTKRVQATVSLEYKLLKKKGEEYMFFPTMTTKLDVEDYTADFRPTNGMDGDVLRTAVHAAISGGHEEILESIRPTLERTISEEVLRLANKICKHFTYNELFPDHE